MTVIKINYRGEPWSLSRGGERRHIVYKDKLLKTVGSMPPVRGEKGDPIGPWKLSLGGRELHLLFEKRPAEFEQISVEGDLDDVTIEKELNFSGEEAGGLSEAEKAVIKHNITYLGTEDFFAFCMRESVRRNWTIRGINLWLNPEDGMIRIASNYWGTERPFDVPTELRSLPAQNLLVIQDFVTGKFTKTYSDSETSEMFRRTMETTIEIFNLTHAYHFRRDWYLEFRYPNRLREFTQV